MLRESGLLDSIKDLGRDFVDRGNVITGPQKSSGEFNYDLSKHTNATVDAGDFALTIGGDHGIATGSIAGVLRKHPDLRVVWLDAHADINTPATSPSGNYHGMPVGHLMGLFGAHPKGYEWMAEVPVLPKENIVFVGIRDVDEGEKRFIRELGIKSFDMF